MRTGYALGQTGYSRGGDYEGRIIATQMRAGKAERSQLAKGVLFQGSWVIDLPTVFFRRIQCNPQPADPEYYALPAEFL